MAGNNENDRRWWSEEETDFLLNVIAEENIVQLLDGRHQRNTAVFRKISERMICADYDRSILQIRNKWKNLKKDYYVAKKIRDNGGKQGGMKPKLYEKMDCLLGSEVPTTTVVTHNNDTNNGCCEYNDDQTHDDGHDEDGGDVTDTPFTAIHESLEMICTDESATTPERDSDRVRIKSEARTGSEHGRSPVQSPISSRRLQGRRKRARVDSFGAALKSYQEENAKLILKLHEEDKEQAKEEMRRQAEWEKKQIELLEEQNELMRFIAKSLVSPSNPFPPSNNTKSVSPDSCRDQVKPWIS